MKLNGIFKKPKNELETQEKVSGSTENKGEKAGKIPKADRTEKRGTPEKIAEEKPEPLYACPKCKKNMPLRRLKEQMNVCECGYHARTGGRERLLFLVDRDSFRELFGELESRDILGFEGYDEKLSQAREGSGEREAVICGTAKINGKKCALFIMEPNFMMGSMGTVVGEKITSLFEYAAEQKLPVIGYTVSGGARMQEGILSLMQMAKTSAAVKRHSQQGLFYLTVLTDPTTGGVTASFAMEGDIIMAEPGATVGFAGARVIEQTIRKKLPEEFQTAEFLQEHGFIDLIVPRQRQRAMISQLLAIHSGQMVFASDSVDNLNTQHLYQLEASGIAVLRQEEGCQAVAENLEAASDQRGEKGDLAYE